MKPNLKDLEEMLENPECNWESIRTWVVRFDQKLREKYLHGKIVEEKGWESEIAERKMCLDLLGEEATT